MKDITVKMDRIPNEDTVLKNLVSGTAHHTGKNFFKSLVENLSKALNTKGAWITEYNADSRKLHGLAFLMDGKWIENYEYDITGTVCEQVILEDKFIHYPDKIIDFFPDNQILKELSAVSYMGVPLKDTDGKALGYIAVLDIEPIPEDARLIDIFNIFSARAAAELQRLKAEARIKEREQKLTHLVDSAMDTIIELDGSTRIRRINSAGEDLFKKKSKDILGESFDQFLTDLSRTKLMELLKKLHLLPEDKRYLWISGGLEAVSANGMNFSAEATLSSYEFEDEIYYTLILRNVNDKLEAKNRISSLIDETHYLKNEINELQNFGEIIGNSESILKIFNEINKVASTDATVLITGETGTGKELVARALHARSMRMDKPLIKVNCAAMSPTLMESEFFGHEKGSFTGATSKREGRFKLADEGTIFLDEVGELPIDLQAKLLRVLQEREFEPVGSSQTVKIDVRIICATNRNLLQMVQDGKFREDLYYRLNVFPIYIPPIRERRDDIPALAESFVQKCSKRLGRTINPLSESTLTQLKTYDWPGNVRELHNVIERAIITSQGSELDLSSSLPEIVNDSLVSENTLSENSFNKILTKIEIAALERNNIINALESTNWKIYGKDGAAELLGMNPSTLRSQMKVFDIKKC